MALWQEEERCRLGSDPLVRGNSRREISGTGKQNMEQINRRNRHLYTCLYRWQKQILFSISKRTKIQGKEKNPDPEIRRDGDGKTRKIRLLSSAGICGKRQNSRDLDFGTT